MIDSELLSILCCPETRQPLKLADRAMIERLNQNIARGDVQTRGGKRVEAALEGGLVREDEQVLYPIRNRIPVMLVQEAIPLR